MGDKPKDPLDYRREFAAERSNQDSQISNENFRAAAQAALLINGGAATGLLAFLSKDKLEPHLLFLAGFALFFYAAGVACAALTHWQMKHALKHWQTSWQRVAEAPGNPNAGTDEHKKAEPWYDKSNVSFRRSIWLFVAGSLVMGLAVVVSGYLQFVRPWPPAPPAKPSPAIFLE